MTSITGDIIERLRDLNIQAYKADKQRIKADFGNERKFTVDYNGRQILELLQNADDAKTDAIQIILNEEDRTLRIANNGISFSAEGLDSLRLAGNSSKNKREFIGNKGLGFRAILNWVNRIRIYTKDYVMEFSPAIATREFYQLIPDSQERLRMIEEREDLMPGTSPFAVLSYMDYWENEDSQIWETIVELQYNSEALTDILEQLHAITPEVLLFLNYTQRIEVIRNDEPIKTLERTFLWQRDEEVRLRVNNIEWNILDSGECKFPGEEKKYYRYKIAWRDDLSDENAVFYNFFPTRANSYLPCLIHATFELTVDRNQLVKHQNNDFVLDKIAEALGTIAEGKLKDKTTSWLPYRLLYPVTSETDKWLTPLYSKLKSLRETLQIYPSVDGNYYRRNEVVFYGNEFSHWIVQKRLGKYCNILLKGYSESQTELKWHRWLVYTDKSILSIVRKLSDQISSINTRCRLIRLLLQDNFKTHRKIKFPLILDIETNLPIDSDKMVFLIRQAAVKDYQVPKYANLRFISPEFYKALLKEFEVEIRHQRIGNEDASRPLKRILNPVLNLGSNDITDVVSSVTRAFIRKRDAGIKPESVERLYKEYVNCLFRIFSSNQERRNTINETIFLRNRLGETKRASELLLGGGFPSGNLNEQLFDGVFTDADYVADIGFWKLGNGTAPVVLLEEFFVWLGVNRRTRTKREIRSFERWADDGYVRFVFDTVGWPDYDSYKKYEVSVVSGIEHMLKSPGFSREQCLAWIITDSTLYNLLRDDANGESFSYTYNGLITPVYKKPSYFKYQLSQAGTFKNVVVDEEVAKQLGLHWVNLKHELFRKLNISETTVLDTLRQLGAVLSFAQLTPEHIFRLLEDCGQQAGSPRKLYELALGYFRQREGEDFSMYLPKLKVWATCNGVRKFMANHEVYYTDNATLPEHILSEYWMFDFPRKRGASQISKVFGVGTFKNLKIEVKDSPILHLSNGTFQTWLETIKPYLLTYRLNNLREDAALRRDVTSLNEEGISGVESANQLKKLNIIVCSAVSYAVNDGVHKQLMPGEFIPLGERNYCLCADASQYLDEWKQSPAFCEAFAEILCMLFDTQKNKEDFKAVLKDNTDLRHTLYNINAASLIPVLEDARSLLGLPAEELRFWKAVLACKQFMLPASVISREALYELLNVILEYRYDGSDDVDYGKWATADSYTLLKELDEKAGISLTAIHDADNSFTGLEAWHYQQFHNTSFNFERNWIRALWKYLETKGDKKQRGFLIECQKYNAKADEAAITLARKYAFDLDVNYSSSLLDTLSLLSGLKLAANDRKLVIRNQYEYLLKAANLLREDFAQDIQSLLFFEGNERIIKDAIEAELARRKPLYIPEPQPGTEGNSAPRTPVHFLAFGTGTLNGTVSISNRAGRTPGTYNGGSDAKRNAAGQRAEAVVYKELTQTYPVVQWISRYSTDNSINKDDMAGYDMRYKLDNNEQSDWYYVEVKSASEDNFVLSRNEVEFAIKNVQHYQLAIVQNGEIYIDRAFFCEKSRVAVFNLLLANSGIRPTHFEVAWKIS